MSDTAARDGVPRAGATPQVVLDDRHPFLEPAVVALSSRLPKE